MEKKSNQFSQANLNILRDIFKRASMNDLPAMSAHVQELIWLTNSKRATANELTEAILKDLSLSNKILQVANSSFYNRGIPINSISRAVTVIGFGTVRDLAMAITLLEDFSQASKNKTELYRLFTISFLAALQVKILAKEKQLRFPSEDAFLCGLFHNLGSIVVLVFLPELYDQIFILMREGKSKQEACHMFLGGLNLHEVGQEIAYTWNFADDIITTMAPDPYLPKNETDEEAYLHTLVVFCNQLTEAICQRQSIFPLIDRYGGIFSLSARETLSYVKKSVDAAEDTSASIRKGLELLNIHDCLQKARLRELDERKAPSEEATDPKRKSGGDRIYNPTGSNKATFSR